jgi:hypothetical protein
MRPNSNRIDFANELARICRNAITREIAGMSKHADPHRVIPFGGPPIAVQATTPRFGEGERWAIFADKTNLTRLPSATGDSAMTLSAQSLRQSCL